MQRKERLLWLLWHGGAARRGTSLPQLSSHFPSPFSFFSRSSGVLVRSICVFHTFGFFKNFVMKILSQKHHGTALYCEKCLGPLRAPRKAACGGACVVTIPRVHSMMIHLGGGGGGNNGMKEMGKRVERKGRSRYPFLILGLSLARSGGKQN